MLLSFLKQIFDTLKISKGALELRDKDIYILYWPKSLFTFFHNMLQKNPENPKRTFWPIQ